MTNQERGIIYIATGETFVSEAEVSAQTLKEHADLHTTLFTDIAVESEYFDTVEQLADPDHDFGDSILTREMVPYKKNLFLDTDTYICDDITSIFDLLDRFDIAAAHNPGSRTADGQEGYTADAPEAFPQYNTGVLLFSGTEKINTFFDQWREEYFSNKSSMPWSLNQPSFRDALYKSDLSIATLPAEYNLRVKYSGSVGFATDKVKILHGRHPAGLPSVAAELNKKQGQRVYTMKRWPIKISTSRPSLSYYVRTILTEGSDHYTFRGRFVDSIKSRGVSETVRLALKELKEKAK